MKNVFAHKPYEEATNEWDTLKWIVKGLGAFDDDPAVPGATDGLTRSWKGCVWLNPPSGPDCKQWIEKLADHNNGVALVFARTETRWFVEQIWERATSILFFYGRLYFLRNGVEKVGGARAPSCLVAYGPIACQKLSRFQKQHGGALVSNWSY